MGLLDTDFSMLKIKKNTIEHGLLTQFKILILIKIKY
jgi:hypothetical protein